MPPSLLKSVFGIEYEQTIDFDDQQADNDVEDSEKENKTEKDLEKELLKEYLISTNISAFSKQSKLAWAEKHEFGDSSHSIENCSPPPEA